jgi:hypothetical protein
MTVRPKEVPEAWKYLVGPYRQAPPEYGGEWWLVNPFSGSEPWLLLDRKAPVPEVLPEGFERARPTWRAYPTRQAFQHDVVVWEQAKKNFIQAGVPPWAGERQLQIAEGALIAWGMGVPAYYEHSFWGWMARFVESKLPTFQMNAHTTIFHTHLVVPNYQVDLLQQGIEPEQRHPLISPEIWNSYGQF